MEKTWIQYNSHARLDFPPDSQSFITMRMIEVIIEYIFIREESFALWTLRPLTFTTDEPVEVQIVGMSDIRSWRAQKSLTKLEKKKKA